MRQPIPSGSTDPLNTAATEYNSIFARGTWTSLEVGRQVMIAGNGILHTLRIVLTAAPGGGGTYTFKIRINGADTALSVVITDPATTGQSFAEVTVAKGDLAAITCIPSGSPSATPNADWSLEYEDTDDYKNNLLIGGHQNALPTGATAESNYIVGGVPWSIIAAGTFGPRIPFPIPGTLKDFYIALTAAPGAGNSYTIVTRINGTNSHSVTISGTATTGNDTTSFTIAAGDIVNIAATGASGPTAASAYWGSIFTPDDANFALVLGGTTDTTNNLATEYHQLTGTGFNYNATEANRRVRGQMSTLGNLYVDLAVAPGILGSGFGQTFTVYKNGSATALSLTISETALVGSNTTDFVEFSDDDTMSLAIIPVGTPLNTTAGWGCAEYTYNQSNYGG